MCMGWLRNYHGVNRDGALPLRTAPEDLRNLFALSLFASYRVLLLLLLLLLLLRPRLLLIMWEGHGAWISGVECNENSSRLYLERRWSPDIFQYPCRKQHVNVCLVLYSNVPVDDLKGVSGVEFNENSSRVYLEWRWSRGIILMQETTCEYLSRSLLERVLFMIWKGLIDSITEPRWISTDEQLE